MHHSYIPALLFCILIVSCNNKSHYPYAIRDFRKALRPDLEKAVTDGVVGHLNNATLTMISDKELVKLSRCEHPVLRAAAFREMLERETFNHADVVMNNLDDTAEVLIDHGEFGSWSNKVSDDLIWKSMWKTYEAKEKAIEQIITHHNYLTSAYRECYTVEPRKNCILLSGIWRAVQSDSKMVLKWSFITLNLPYTDWRNSEKKKIFP